MDTKWIVGAYALHATLEPWHEPEQERFRSELLDIPTIRGLEIPLPASVDERWLASLPPSWDYILTLLPATMQSLSSQASFGLASASPEGRAAALQLVMKAQRTVAAIHEHVGHRVVRAVHLHSAPSRRSPLGLSDWHCLNRSLEEIASWEWSGAELILEHCDAFRSDTTSIKGFLSLEDELRSLVNLPVGMGVNWGRSVLETRDARGALQHVEAIHAQGLLRSFVFSGTCLQDPLYGDWQDNHAPIALGSSAAWEPRGGLLTVAEVEAVAARLAANPPPYLGLKVQAFPRSLDLESRLACLKAQLAALETHFK